MSLEVVTLDVHDDAAFAAWHAAYAEAELATGAGVGSPWQLEEVRAIMQEPGTRSRQLGWSGLVDGEVATVGWARLPLLDNLERAELAVHTVPAHRRQGHGSAMLAHVERAAAESGRTILVGEASWPYAAGADGAGQPGPAFAARHGYELALGDVKRTLALPVDPALLDALTVETAAHHEGYTLRSWVGPVPDDLVAGWARLVATLMTEAPVGELDVEPESDDPAVVRETEASLARQGRTKCQTVALAPDGELVAYTDLVTTVHEPTRAYQWGTLVRRDHRGHRLGLAVKVANLRQLQVSAPGVTELTTYNAEVNRPMIEVNERLGFRPVARLGEFQKRR